MPPQERMVVAHASTKAGICYLEGEDASDADVAAEAMLEAILVRLEGNTAKLEELHIEFCNLDVVVQSEAISRFMRNSLPCGYYLTVEKETSTEIRLKLKPSVPGEWQAICR